MSLICTGIDVLTLVLSIKLVYSSHPIVVYVCLVIKNAHHTAHINDSQLVINISHWSHWTGVINIKQALGSCTSGRNTALDRCLLYTGFVIT